MRLPRPVFIISLLLTVSLVLFYNYGRAIWHPIKVKATGQKTVDDVLQSLDADMRKEFSDLDSLTNGEPIAILAFKEERKLELWKDTKSGWKHVRNYAFTNSSGRLGPKLKEGDLQIPEGIYGVEYLNPNSSYHLSIKIDYPNAFDRAKAKAEGRTGLGGDIFIHGMSVTIGCIPVGNKNVEEIFYLVAKNGYPNTKVIISPYDMRKKTKPLEIASVTWEDELYALIEKSLVEFKKK